MRLLAEPDATALTADAPAAPAAPTAPAAEDRATWAGAHDAVRRRSVQLAAGLSAENQGLQSMADASPTHWQRAHATWFFETLLLQAFVPGYRPEDARWAPLFNSYCEALGPRHPRPQRGLLSLPRRWPASAAMRPPPARPGPARGCRPNLNGNMPPPGPGRSSNFSARCGSGFLRPMRSTQASGRCPVRRPTTTANS